MSTINITNFRKNIFEYLNRTIQYNEPLSITTKTGNAVILSEEDYLGLMETLYLSSNAKLKKEIIEGLKTPIQDCIPCLLYTSDAADE